MVVHRILHTKLIWCKTKKNKKTNLYSLWIEIYKLLLHILIISSLLIYFQKVFTLGPTHFLVFFAWILRFWLKPLPVNYEIKKMAIQTKHENNISGLFWFHTFEKSNLTFLSFVQLLLPFSQSFFSFLFFSLKSTLFFILSLPLYFRSLFFVNQISSFALLIFL